MCLANKSVNEKDFDYLLSITNHLHIADSIGIDGEGVMIGEGDISNKPYLKKAFNTKKTKVLEVWQGHLNNFRGFRESLSKTLNYF